MVSVGIVPVSQVLDYQYAFISGDLFNIVGFEQGPCSFCPNEGPIVETTAMGRHAVYGYWEQNTRPVAYCSGCSEKYVIRNPKMVEFLVREVPVLPKDMRHNNV